ncbi:sensor histidine kinase [uncultured Jatrophihabitans sp.]|uniref:sensor histidine kinase n=1 Tax=uncultured Jatrophihabitans sp. TaxID=1610747 RepID=UPI0035CA419F
MSLLADAKLPDSWNPLWYRVPAWTVIIAVSVYQTHGLAERVATTVLMVMSALALQLVQNDPPAVRQAAVLICTITGLIACFTAPQGLAEILVVVVAGRAPHAFEGRPLTWFTIVDTIAFGATVGIISRSYPGLLAGMGIPLFVQRAVEHRDLVRERDRATALLAEVQRGRESEARAAALQERGRIAREMHDVLAHSLAGLSVQLQAVRAVAAREQVGPAVLEPLDKAATLARDGLAEARSAVSTLHDPITLGLDALPALVDRHPGDATLTVEGPPGTLSGAAGHAVYRAVQESLTNAARYAPGGSVQVRLGWHPDRLTVAVTDTGPGVDRAPVSGVGSGLGLAGMDERVSSVGGMLRAGPSGTGWCVELDVPTVPASVQVGS